MAVALYSPKDVFISLAGLHTISGYADGTFVRITKDMKPFSKVRAMDGEMARMYNEDEGFRVEITVAQSSGSNNILSAIYNVDAATQMGKFPLLIKDSKGQTSFFAATAWIEQIPEVTFSNQLETRTWTFGCSGAAITIGGNGDTNLLEDALLVGSAGLGVLKQFGVF
jgi:hypothetical protein